MENTVNHHVTLARTIFTKYMKETGLVYTPSEGNWNCDKWLMRAVKAFVCYRGTNSAKAQEYVRNVVEFYTTPPLIKGEGEGSRGLEGFPFFNSRSRPVIWDENGKITGQIENCDFSPFPSINYHYDNFVWQAKKSKNKRKGL